MTKPYHALRNQTWLVTGASSGIGAAIAAKLAPEAAALILTGRSEEGLAETAAKAEKLGTCRITCLPHDLSASRGSGRLLARKIRSEHPGLSGIVHAAGGSQSAPHHERDPAAIQKELQCNSRSILELTHELAPLMSQNAPGWILNIASVVGFFGLPTQATYSATKAWLISLGCALHHELKKEGITVTTVCPGATRTQFMENAGIDMSRRWVKAATWQSADEVADFALRSLAAGRLIATPGLKNRTMVFLNRFLTRSMIAGLVRKQMEIT